MSWPFHADRVVAESGTSSGFTDTSKGEFNCLSSKLGKLTSKGLVFLCDHMTALD